MGVDEMLNGLRRQVARTLATNALPLARLAGGRSPNPPRSQWNLVSKLGAGLRIADEEGQRAFHHHNDEIDAMRHARWSGRMAQEAGPIFSGAVGVEHELENIGGSVLENAGRHLYPDSYPPKRRIASVPQTLSESAMDLHNNLEGISAAMANRSIDPARLQNQPARPSGVLNYRRAR